MSDNIKVVVKVRPLISREIEDKLSYQWRVKNNTLYQLDQNGKDHGQSFTFDRVYDKDTKTSDVYDDIAKPIVEAAAAGFNGTIFAYGQTSSGKTYTMTGTDSSPGIIPLAILNLFEIIKNVPDRDFLVRVSYIEIYNETVKDLLNVEKENIKIQETHQGIKVDATEEVTSSPEEVLAFMKQGEANRQKGATNMNEQSSRSHSIFQIIIESREHIEGEEEAGCVNVSQLNLVDLAGSERSGQTGATGIRFKEGTHINKSLSALALVIKQLSEDPKKHANYRDSKLTRILQNSLGGNAKTSIICAITPACVDETISTLQFANRAKAIKNKPEVNAVATDATMIQRLTKQMCKLQSQLERKKNLEQDNYKLQIKIASLQKLILNGFAQGRSMDLMGGTRRKLQQPRRVTISTLHSIEDEPAINIPKFCTPSLKYNPMSIPIPGVAELRLPSVPEEPRLVTPPPTRAVGFSDDVITLDSDDDDSAQDDAQTCSPIHKCYGASKTPPCVLRRNAKLAEKNLKDIVELTEREKMYTPNVVEYIEKLEQNTNIIAKLEDEIDMLNKQSKEKDLQMEHLKSIIKKTEGDMKSLTSAKNELLAQCDNYSTRLTDAEVSYETLRNKAKLREEELLSLLEELTIRNKKPDDIGKLMSRTLDKETHFMDISKDISLVNSDNESSIVHTNDVEPEIMNGLVTDTQTQLNIKNQNMELEANIFEHQQNISSLECQNQDLQEKIAMFKEKLTLMENENSLLKTTIDTLNMTIKGQKENLETANNDIDSYNSLIQELQIKITQKETLPNININDSVLESMIANEEKFIANNENMKNIIHSLKIALDVRNKEIDNLKKSLLDSKNVALNNKTLTEELESQSKEVDILNKEVYKLRRQINENIAIINQLKNENNDLKVIEHELTAKLASFQDNSNKIEKINNENLISIKRLTEENHVLAHTIADKNTVEQEITDINKQLMKQIGDMTQKIHDIEKEIRDKDDIISSLKEGAKQSQDCFHSAKAAVLKSQLILGTLSGNMQEVPYIIDNFVNIFSVLSEKMNSIESVAIDIVRQKDEAIKNQVLLETELKELTSKHNTDISELQEQIKILSKTESKNFEESDTLTQKINQLKTELQITRNKLENQISENKTLQAYLNEAKENMETCHQTIATLTTEKTNLDQTLIDRTQMVENITVKLEAIQNALKEKISEMETIQEQFNNTKQEREKLFDVMLHKVRYCTSKLNILDDKDVENDNCEIHKRILLTLDKLGHHITFINMKNIDDVARKESEILLEAKKEILDLTQKNENLVEKLSETEDIKNELSLKLKTIQYDNKNLNEELFASQNILQNLQKELKLKANELSNMEVKVREWKEQFTTLDRIMKQQIGELKSENEYFKDRISDFRQEPEHESIVPYKHEHSYDIDNNAVTLQQKVSDPGVNDGTRSPPSLLTICCNKIIDSIQPKDADSKITTSTNAEVSAQSDDTHLLECKCKQLSAELKAAREENTRIAYLLEQMEDVNLHLIQEQEAIRSEIKLLVAPAHELQKKIVNHKTNLAILTATTYAENWSLKSQVKVLQHHHSRYHNVCQRDIPEFKKKLNELMAVLRRDLSIADQQNASFKRYSLPNVLDSSTSTTNFKNESTLDGDLLMLDTNITITTAADNTLTGHDQTCLDLTQFYNEASCQTNELNQLTDYNTQDMQILSRDYQVISEKLNLLKNENDELRQLLKTYTEMKQCMTDTQSSPIKINNEDNNYVKELECGSCKNKLDTLEKLNEELKSLSLQLTDLKSQKTEIETKYNNLVLEIPSTDILLKKLSKLEKDYNIKLQEITNLSSKLSNKTLELKRLQEENDLLSTQMMESISESDVLNKELENVKKVNDELIEKCSKLELSQKNCENPNDSVCSDCIAKDELIQTMQKRLAITHTKLNRSLSDSDSSSRYNMICTLQSELHAGKEDCKELTEDVVTIKNHLERGDLSMDLDDSMGESNIYPFTKEFENSSTQSNTCNLPDIPEERTSDVYIMDKLECLNYYIEKTGNEKCTINSDIKIVELMKMLYEYLITKHGSEVANMTNKLKDYDESKRELETQIYHLIEKNSQVTMELKQKEQNSNSVSSVLARIKDNINIINQEIINVTDMDVNKLVNIYIDRFFKILDSEFGMSSIKMFESLISVVNKYQTELINITDRYTKLQENFESITKEFNSANENLAQIRSQLTTKENEYNLLQVQKERIHEISNAVTLDLVKKDKELTDAINNGYKKLIEMNVVENQHVDLTLPLNISVNLLFDHLINQHKKSFNPDMDKEKERFELEVKKSKQIVEEKEKEIELLQARATSIQEINSSVTMSLVDKENQLQAQKALHEDLIKIYERKVEENKANEDLIDKLSEEIKLLKATNEAKTKTIENLETKNNAEQEIKVTELMETIKALQDNVSHLKAINSVIVKEKDGYALELLKSGETIKQNIAEMDKMTSDILTLRESIRDNGNVIENLNLEAKNLLKQNMELKEQLEDKCKECYRLETNMKTHEKAAEVQTRMITRLQKQRIEDENAMKEKTKQIEELTHKCATLQKQYDVLHAGAKDMHELEQLRKTKETLEARVSELEALLESQKSRLSIDAIADSSRRRRQSLHDSKRLFADDKHEIPDHNNLEAVFESRPKPDDLFMDVDDDISNRSSPIRLSKGRDSLSLSRTDQSDKDEEHPSRPSSVMAARRRRQSIHDLHRSVLRHTPSPHGLDSSNRITDEINHSKPPDALAGNDSNEVSELKNRLASCQQELEELKEKYRELDEECETCAEYLRERDEQCARLKKERTALQLTITQLKEQLLSPELSQQNASKPSVAHVAVNTDEDWTNLHSVVVDRMSFDAEVEKNKRLTKTIEELRFKKQDLKNTIAKMQKALERNAGSRELESTKKELQACKQELLQLRERYKDLDEECETCAQYLRDREEQCRRLKEAKMQLEAKLQEYQSDVNVMAVSTRKKRQSLHDQNRPSTLAVQDASTETSDDFLSYQVERDANVLPPSEEMQTKEMQRLKAMVKKLSQQKMMLEQQLAGVSAAMHPPQPMYVATGSAIVQNQQLTDVMKENQKLKKINAKLVNICKKRGKDSNRENEDPVNQG